MKLKVTLIIVATITLLTGAVYYFTRPHKKPLLQVTINKSTEKPPEQTEENIASSPEATAEELQPEQVADEAEISTDDKQAISSWVKEQEEAWLTGDVTLFKASLYCSEDNQDYCEERITNFEARHAEKEYQRVEFILEGIEKIGENLKVYVHEAYDYTLRNTGEAYFSEVNYVYNLEKVNGEWKCYASYKN